MATPAPVVVSRRLLLTGRVQGVGFRPFVYRLAHELRLAGFVRNLRGDVEIVLMGPVDCVERFARDVVARAPPLARPVVSGIVDCEAPPTTGFTIEPSSAALQPQVSVPPDFFCCPDCLDEMARVTDRRHRYAFINCTQCGPRYTLIEALPYDRPNTSMRGFPLCPECQREYQDPLDRRFHAEPVACPACGPHLSFVDGAISVTARADGRAHDDEAALEAAVRVLLAGRVLAVKGVGGYHLLCDARSLDAVARLRARKQRPDKPLAVMYPWRGADGLDAVRRDFVPEPAAVEALLDPARPIVLLRGSTQTNLAGNVAPGLDEVGVFLPYSPLHQLLLEDFGGPLVATSGNVSGEPVLTQVDEASQRLAHVADAFLHHDRPIVRPADDSVMRVIAGRARPLRIGRGIAPLELELPRPVPRPVLAVGGHLKSTVALAWGKRIVVSPHIGDMGTLRSEQVFVQVAADLQRLYDVRAEIVLSDAHPDYATTRWARASGLEHATVQHHRAHASALMAEHGVDETALVFAWDGVGLGDDGTLWGGETFVGRPGHWQRAATLRPFHLPGGDRAGRAPWRSAAAVCWELGREFPGELPDPIVRSAWQRRLNSPQTSAAGRLFDAASALVLGLGETSFEGQGPMWLEAVACDVDEFPQMSVAGGAGELLTLDWQPLIEWLLRERKAAPARQAGAVHATLAAAIAEVACRLRERTGSGVVGLTGGVFQNRRLCELAVTRLHDCGFEVRLQQRLPCNDGGLSFGQLADFAGRSD
jgi:hydrogenase maturation protein HypF